MIYGNYFVQNLGVILSLQKNLLNYDFIQSYDIKNKMLFI